MEEKGQWRSFGWPKPSLYQRRQQFPKHVDEWRRGVLMPFCWPIRMLCSLESWLTRFVVYFWLCACMYPLNEFCHILNYYEMWRTIHACVSCVQDIATRVIAEGLRPEQTMVSKVMTRNPIFVTSDTLAIDALQKMVQG